MIYIIIKIIYGSIIHSFILRYSPDQYILIPSSSTSLFVSISDIVQIILSEIISKRCTKIRIQIFIRINIKSFFALAPFCHSVIYKML